MKAVSVRAYAKVNLSLEVLGKRPDGFHEVRSVMQTIDLADELVLEEAPTLSVECDIPELANEGNLAALAARRFLQRHLPEEGALIRIRKRIPVAGGLGGASSDAASVLAGLVSLYELRLQPADLQILASDLGSDVPFFLTGGSALVKGRGQLVFPLPDGAGRWLVLLVPPHSVSQKTATLYRRLTPEAWTSGERTGRLATTISTARTIPDNLLGNVFEPVASSVFPSLDAAREAMLEAGSHSVHLSGAGPALFSIFESETEANEVAGLLSHRRFNPYVARSLSSSEAAPAPIEVR